MYNSTATNIRKVNKHYVKSLKPSLIENPILYRRQNTNKPEEEFLYFTWG